LKKKFDFAPNAFIPRRIYGEYMRDLFWETVKNKPENLTQHYQKLTSGRVEEINFVGAFERVVVRLNLSIRQPIIVTRPKTETAAFPLNVEQTVDVELVRFRILPNSTLATEPTSQQLTRKDK